MSIVPCARTARNVLALLSVAWLLAACSVPRLMYQNADWLLMRRMNEYLALEGAQHDRVAEALAARLADHRTRELPTFAAAFEDAAARARRGLSEDDARWLLKQGRALLVSTVDGTLPLVADALAALDERQRRQLAERIEQRNRDYSERHLLEAPREQRFARRAARTVDRVEDWTGPLDEAQVALVHELRDAMPDSAGDWLTYSRERQQALLALLDGHAPAARIEALLRGWWLRLEHLPAALAAKRDRQIEGIVQLIVRLDATLNSTQRLHLVGRLEDLARDARALAQST